MYDVLIKNSDLFLCMDGITRSLNAECGRSSTPRAECPNGATEETDRRGVQSRAVERRQKRGKETGERRGEDMRGVEGGEAEEMRGNRQEKGNETGEECIQSRAEETNKGVERRGNRQKR